MDTHLGCHALTALSAGVLGCCFCLSRAQGLAFGPGLRVRATQRARCASITLRVLATRGSPVWRKSLHQQKSLLTLAFVLER